MWLAAFYGHDEAGAATCAIWDHLGMWVLLVGTMLVFSGASVHIVDCCGVDCSVVVLRLDQPGSTHHDSEVVRLLLHAKADKDTADWSSVVSHG